MGISNILKQLQKKLTINKICRLVCFLLFTALLRIVTLPFIDYNFANALFSVLYIDEPKKLPG